ncbi:MAG: Asp-tRNA(Asn)/Glu-tRNA(Gln) amidotransferase subunit GatA [Acidimicrobiia bacterium]|nr:Asp-tRNA(Asn)/Glu-tRNA(Gln) amidotransferase subunit GatA [Acidimicrobiia bacterium]
MTELSQLTLVEAAVALRSGECTSVALTESVLHRASLTEASVHAYLTIDRQGAMAAAEASDRRIADEKPIGPLDGLPIALKDNMMTKGIETTASSKILSGYIPPYDGTVVKLLREAGAVFVGKTNMDEFAMGSSTENSAYGPTRNPWNLDTVPGGSSGGSAAAVAAGSALAGLGSDTGGSIRQPAALCGLVGMKPTYGLVSRYGLIAFASSLDQIGPLTRSVQDAAVLYEVIAGHDPHDATSFPGPAPSGTERLGAGVEGLRVGVVNELSGEGIDDEVLAAFRATVDRLANAGAEIVELSLPSTATALSAYYLIAPAECSANLARFDGVRYGLRVEGSTVDEMMSLTRAEGFGSEVIRRILLGTYALSAGYYDAFYGQAQRVRTLIIQEFATAYQQVDVLVSPTAPAPAFELGAKTQDPLSMYMQDICTIPSNLSGHPAMSVPVGLSASGLPIGFQVMAPALGETVMFQVASAIEALSDDIGRPVLEVVAS